MTKWILSFFFLSISSTLYATTFMRTSIDNQLKEADSVFIGHFLEQRSVQVEDGQVATQMVFKLSKEFGLNSELFGLEEILVHYPGGTWEGQTVAVDGVPTFSSGEKVVIMAKNIDNRLWGLNLALGSFKLINYGKETLLVNQVFPKDPKVSQIRLIDFEMKVKGVKGSSLKTVRSLENHEKAKKAQGKNRSIASIDESLDNSEEASSQSSTFWLLVSLGIAGALAGYRVQRGR